MASKETEEALAKVRKRFATDFEFFCKHAIKIRTKDGEIKPLMFNAAQKRFVERIEAQRKATGKVRFVILKARQMGFSTVIMAYEIWWLIFHQAQKGLCMAHVSDSTSALFDMYKRSYDNLPEPIKPATKYNNRNELTFPGLDSAVRVSTAGGRGVARGETLTVVHLSEVAFWPIAFANANFGGLIKAVPTAPGTAIFIESTANGMTGKFKELWDGAVQGINGFEPFFAAWHEMPEYRLPVAAGFVRTVEEALLAAQYGLDDEQLAWRRQEIARDGTELFKQECPAYPDEAFLSTGAPVFNPAQLQPLIQPATEPLSRWLVTDGGIEQNAAGELHVFHDYHDTRTGKRTLVDPTESYVIGADVGMGIRGRDYSVAQILDSQKRQVAVWRGIVHPDYFAAILNTLGLYYNEAMVCVERNNHGLLTAVKLRDRAYPRLWTEVSEGALDDRDSINIGIFTSERTKPLIIDRLRASLREDDIFIKDPTTIRELLTYVVTESGKMEGDGDSHDDCVMSLAIANYIHEGRWEPCETPEGLYHEVI